MTGQGAVGWDITLRTVYGAWGCATAGQLGAAAHLLRTCNADGMHHYRSLEMPAAIWRAVMKNSATVLCNASKQGQCYSLAQAALH